MTFVNSIKTAEKKPRLGVVECSVLDVCFFISRLGVIGRSMFDPPKADKCLLASGEFDVHLLK